MRIANRLARVRLDSLDVEAEPAKPVVDDSLRSFLLSEQGTLANESSRQVAEVFDPPIDGTCDRIEHGPE